MQTTFIGAIFFSDVYGYVRDEQTHMIYKMGEIIHTKYT